VSRSRVLIVVALVVVFAVVVGVVIYTSTQRGAPKDLTFTLTVTGGKTMQPSELKAHQGDHITIKVVSDQEGEVHLHEYDIAFESTAAGQTVTHTFTADKTCRCEIEWEDTSTPLGTLTVSP
jgi:Cupredoxin-like domain